MKTVLIVGSGGREHAIAWKLSQSTQVNRIIVAPGNAGMPEAWEKWPIRLSEGIPEFRKLAEKACHEKVSLIVIGPDNPLADGIVDVLDEYGLLCFGPKAEAAKIESSKIFSKELMVKSGVPTASYWSTQKIEEARKLIKSIPWKNHPGWVLKVDGLAFGKGVEVCHSADEALLALERLSQYSEKLVIEECLVGEELSWMAFCDGTNCALLSPARDYKRLSDSNQGPNTGGMGAFSPVPNLPLHLEEKVKEQVF